MTAKQRYWWVAVVIAFIFCPIFAIVLYGDSWGVLPFLVSSPVLLVSGFILIVRHGTFLGVIPIIFAFGFLFLSWVLSQGYHFGLAY
jgi:hypothetical protein